jgi:hypothetical protein
MPRLASMYVISSSLFNFSKTLPEKWVTPHITAVTEASQLGPARDGQFWLNKIWIGSQERGICIKSEKTGQQVRYRLTRTYRHDGDTTHWEFQVIPEDRHRCGDCLTVTIYND